MLIKSEDLQLNYGFVVWWTLTSNKYLPSDLYEAAQTCKLPPSMCEFDPVDAVSAFEKIANLQGKQSIPGTTLEFVDPPGSSVKWTTRKITTSEYLLIREVLDQKGKTMAANSLDIGTLILDMENSKITFGFFDDVDQEQFKDDTDNVTEVIKMLVNERITTVDENKLRKNFLAWAKANHRIALRENGGVYFIPNHGQVSTRKIVLDEIFAIRCFLSKVDGGSITSLEVISTDAFDPARIIEDATRELDAEFTELETLIDSAITKKDGTIHAKTKTRIDSELARLRDKIVAIDETFDVKLTELETRFEVARSFNRKIEYQ